MAGEPRTRLASVPARVGDTALAGLDRARLALAECRTAMEAKQIADVAEAARVYLQRTNAAAETVNRATEIRTLAERQMGEFLQAMPKATGAAGNPGGQGAKIVRSDSSTTQTLKDMGITKDQSARAQKLAEIPAAELQQRMDRIKASGEKLSTAKVVNFLRPTRRSPEQFNLKAWKAATSTIIDLRLRGVPEKHLDEAIDAGIAILNRYRRGDRQNSEDIS